MQPIQRRDFLARSAAAACAFSLPLRFPGRAQEVPFDVVVQRDVMVRMRDGVHLATDVYRPARNGTAVPDRFPVILERTPYDKTADSRSERTPVISRPKSRAEVARFFVERGYVVIYQDCRGRYKSEGEFVKYLSDGSKAAPSS